MQEKYENEGFDLYYEVGNTTSMDKAPNVPSPMGERIGSLAQRGGGFFEVLIENPTTFQIDRESMFNVINQLGADISLHSNPNIGYTSTYRANYDATHNYFTKYLEQVASFKKDAEIRSRQSSEFGFQISRINPHISTSPLPDLEEERAQGTGLDPFGYSIADLNDDLMDEKDAKNKNIYRNTEFLKRLYRVLIREELGDREYGQYQEISSFSPKFDKAWRTAQNDVANKYFDNIKPHNGTTELESKAEVLVAGANDPAARKKWMQFLKKEEYNFESIDIPSSLQPELRGLEITEIGDLADFEKFVRVALGQRYSVSDLQRLSDLLYYLKNNELQDIRDRRLKQQGGDISVDLGKTLG